jgi:MFS family permease
MRQVIIAGGLMVVVMTFLGQVFGWTERVTAGVSGGLASLIIMPPFIASQQQSGLLALWIVILLVGVTGRWRRWAFGDRFLYGTAGIVAVIVIVGGCALFGRASHLRLFLYPNRWITSVLEQLGVVC